MRNFDTYMLVETVAQSLHPLIAVTKTPENDLEIVCLFWYDSALPDSTERHLKAHLLIDEAHLRNAQQIFDTWLQYDEYHYPERQLLSISGTQQETVYRWLSKQPHGTLSWIPQSITTPDGQTFLDYWEYNIPFPLRAKINPCDFEPRETHNARAFQEQTGRFGPELSHQGHSPQAPPGNDEALNYSERLRKRYIRGE